MNGFATRDFIEPISNRLAVLAISLAIGQTIQQLRYLESPCRFVSRLNGPVGNACRCSQPQDHIDVGQTAVSLSKHLTNLPFYRIAQNCSPGLLLRDNQAEAGTCDSPCNLTEKACAARWRSCWRIRCRILGSIDWLVPVVQDKYPLPKHLPCRKYLGEVVCRQKPGRSTETKAKAWILCRSVQTASR